MAASERRGLATENERAAAREPGRRDAHRAAADRFVYLSSGAMRVTVGK